MQNPTLFPLDEPIVAAEDRTEPTLWLRRLVIVSDLQTIDRPIRDIPFRRGLNVVGTRRRPADEPRIVGHSVGKTLLMRFIRHTLGEPYYAIEGVRHQLASHLPEAHLVAHWRVNGVDWIVVRPLHHYRASRSFAVASDDWRTAIAQKPATNPFKEFLAAVAEATVADPSGFQLPKAGRPPQWLNLLGWLSRDWECGYRVHNDWRHPEAASSGRLHRVDAKQLVQWVVGLTEDEEIALQAEHQTLLQDKKREAAQCDIDQQKVDTLGPILLKKLEIAQDDDVGLLAVDVIKPAEDKIGSLQRLRAESLQESRISVFESAEDAARERFVVADSEFRTACSRVAFLEAQIETQLKADSAEGYKRRSPYEKCRNADCPMKADNRPAPEPDPSHEQTLVAQREELAEAILARNEKEASVGERRAEYDESRNRTRSERQRLEAVIAGIDREIGRLQAHKEDAESYVSSRSSLTASQSRIAELDRRIDDSIQNQKVARRRHRDRVRRISRFYDQTLKSIFGEDLGGKIVIGRNGLRPVPDARLTPNGGGLSAATLVIAFDLAMLTASVAGVGRHPRFLLHDSPRTGEMEEVLFHRVLHVAKGLENLFGECEPSFQYIVATVTPLPPEIADESLPYLRLTLDARRDSDRLLRAVF